MESKFNGYPSVGIDHMAAYVPGLYVDIQDFSTWRNLDANKLKLGLGIHKMSVPDTDEDASTMGAEAILKLLIQSNTDPSSIGRIYLGTESALDGSKPTATYILNMLEMYFGEGVMRQCDVVDLTFACIGAVDALQNCLDWIRINPDQKAIVVASDHAKYSFHSPGEYTQGAGAVAMLLTANPGLISFGNQWGISTEAVHDFFKPLRRYSSGIFNGQMANIDQDDYTPGNRFVYFHTSTPVYDGPYSNECYQNRMTDAFDHFCRLAEKDASIIDKWDRLVFHLPYAFHAKRVFHPVFVKYLQYSGKFDSFCEEYEMEPISLYQDSPAFYRSVNASIEYKKFVEKKISKGQSASSEIGNLYTGSIFMSLMSTLEADLKEGIDLTDAGFGFFAYGSGSKSKVFQGEVKIMWKDRVEKFDLQSILEKRQAIGKETYAALHTETQEKALYEGSRIFRRTYRPGEGHMKHAIFYDMV
jgi:hydroxymethylglutaryl-CoA synthase